MTGVSPLVAAQFFSGCDLNGAGATPRWVRNCLRCRCGVAATAGRTCHKRIEPATSSQQLLILVLWPHAPDQRSRHDGESVAILQLCGSRLRSCCRTLANNRSACTANDLPVNWAPGRVSVISTAGRPRVAGSHPCGRSQRHRLAHSRALALAVRDFSRANKKLIF
jgi:hypothetical protein